jgi:hypothetical protein
MEPIRLRVAGVAALANAVLTLPMLVLILLLGVAENRTADLFVAAFELIGAGIVTLIYLTLAVLLRHLGIDIRIWAYVYIGLSWLGLVPTAIGLARTDWEDAMTSLSLVFIFLCGIALAGLGVTLLKAADTLFGLRSAVAGLHLAMGIALFTVICLPIGLLASVANDAVLALLFFRAARSPLVTAPEPGPAPKSDPTLQPSSEPAAEPVPNPANPAAGESKG